MKTRLFISACVAFVFIMLFSACKPKPKTEAEVNTVKADSGMSKQQLIDRGNYLVTIMGCGDCHTPKNMTPQGPQPIQSLLLSGYRSDMKMPKIDKNALKEGWILFTGDLNASVGPWGITYAANISSDATGIGNWPEENFMRALKQGKFKGIEGGRTLMPPMPWQNISVTKDDDLKAIYAYLKSIPPVNNVVPMNIAPEDIK